MLLIGAAVSISAGGLSSDAIQSFFALLSQVFTLDDSAKGLLDNDVLF